MLFVASFSLFAPSKLSSCVPTYRRHHFQGTVNNLIRNVSTRWRIALAFLVIYAPFLALLFSGDGAGNWRTLLKLSPFLPSVAIQALTGIPSGPGFLQRWEFTVLFALVWFGAVILGFVKLRRAFWPFAAGTMLVSCLFVWIILQLLKA
jgi:hypothetical protein